MNIAFGVPFKYDGENDLFASSFALSLLYLLVSLSGACSKSIVTERIVEI